MPMFTIVSVMLEGWVNWHAGAGVEDLAKMREGHRSYKEANILIFDPIEANELARAEAAAGEIDAALRQSIRLSLIPNARASAGSTPSCIIRAG